MFLLSLFGCIKKGASDFFFVERNFTVIENRSELALGEYFFWIASPHIFLAKKMFFSFMKKSSIVILLLFLLVFVLSIGSNIKDTLVNID